MSYADGAPRRVLQGVCPVRVTLGIAVSEGDLLGYSSGWVLADANAGVPARLIAGEDGILAEGVVCYTAAIIDGVSGATAGGYVYLSDTAGDYAESASGTSEQKVGQFISATEMFVSIDRQVEKFQHAVPFAAADVAIPFFLATQRCRVTAIHEVHGTVAGQAGTMTVERCQGTEDAAAGDDLLGTTKIDLAGTKDTVQSPALTATVANLILEIGDRLLFLISTGAATSLAEAVITVELERL